MTRRWMRWMRSCSWTITRPTSRRDLAHPASTRRPIGARGRYPAPMIFTCLLAALALRPEFTPVLRVGAIDGSCADLRVVALDGTIAKYAGEAAIAPAEWPAIQPGAI